MTAKTFIEQFYDFAPRWLLTEFAEKWVGATLLLPGDAAREAMSQARFQSWLLEQNSPPDAVPLVGKERRLPRYPGESLMNYRMRVWDAWSAYEFGGSKEAIESQLEIAGFPGQVMYSGPFGQSEHYSQFWIYFPAGTHGVTAAGPEFGSFDWGDGTRWGPVGMPFEQLKALMELVKKWKHSQWICRAMVFEISGFLYGTGKKWGEHKWGGRSAALRPS